MANLQIKDPPVFTEQVHQIEEEEYLTAELENEIKGALLNNEVFLKVLAEAIQKTVKEHIGNEDLHVTAQNKNIWSNKAAADHSHDERYYTEAEVNNLFNEKLREIFRGRGRFTGNIDNLYNKSDNGIYWCAVPEGCNGDFPSEMTGILYFFLTVESDNDGSAKQTIVTWDNFITLVRMRVNNVWSAWKRLVLAENIYNPNILINADFTIPINQRGQTSYTTEEYTIDRWYIGNGTIYVRDGYIELYRTGHVNSFRQFVELDAAGKTLTFSVCTTENKVYSNTQCINAGGAYNYTEVEEYKIRMWYDPDRKLLTAEIYCDGNNDSAILRLKWAKLEVGSVATQFVPPDQTVELLKCQRYYYKIKLNEYNSEVYLGIGIRHGSNSFYVPFKLPVPMRIAPTFSGTGGEYMLPWNCGQITRMTAQIDSSDTGTVKLVVTTDKNLENEVIFVMLGGNWVSNGYIEFDAEMIL